MQQVKGPQEHTARELQVTRALHAHTRIRDPPNPQEMETPHMKAKRSNE